MIHVQCLTTEKTHKRLSAMAKDRGMSLARLCAAVLEWGAEQDAATLHRFGVRVPIYPGEDDAETSTDTDSDS